MAFFSQWKPPGRVISLVGGGGKTTLMYHLAQIQASLSKRVLVMTTTKIYLPERQHASTSQEAESLWAQGRFAVIGTPLPDQGKLTLPPPDLWNALLPQADLVLIEADGARHHPIKVPRDAEPVILPQSDAVIAVMGLSAIGKPLEICCFGFEQACALLGTDPGHLLTEADAAKLLAAPQGGRKGAGARPFSVILNQCDDPQRHSSARRIAADLRELGIKQVYFASFSEEERNFYQRMSQRICKTKPI